MNRKMVRRVVGNILVLATVAMFQPMAFAEILPAPTGRVLLTVSGDITRTNSEFGAQFDYDMLKQLGLIEKNIVTPWTAPDSRFTGVLARNLMEQVGARGQWVRATAANDFSANIPLTDLTEFNTLFALSLNGERMQLRNKGPIWLIYPTDSRPEETDAEINKRMVWQLVSLEIYK